MDHHQLAFVRRYFRYQYVPEPEPGSEFNPHTQSMRLFGELDNDAITPVHDHRPILLLLLPDRTAPMGVSSSLYENRLAISQRILGEWAIIRHAVSQTEIVAGLCRDPCMVIMFTHTLEGINSSPSGPDLREYAMRGGKVVVSRALHGCQAD
ncbi:hypothetical protein MGG_10593 [Pyricularia oryzae 70-15]|uniref:Uncharacterized protein n=3 Tax=Pyricularia oryzae TaxID=318829 RepID=G5EHF3_PYRO7|nr:uncharacterized protein MGG_10593 [Pyricularia oryzae 70-15]ELQ40841.1 hypothetical protein OOU_Y34scaffold00334g11 [Pyricularia oryzae Y34]KAI7915956.1 hypothetical protein M0657_008822 [Pyricularia oryzae]EAQ70739.1 hypothetical protein MGCH7_ch7g146 [Pyricularia oryzae 70-15]EHA46610.1 hypothetical protein MGG_10593 [Pyricularia oryzae 70-15]KAI7918430.1 hypothetical protein M9X92_006908 [Pyricularia oryzae]